MTKLGEDLMESVSGMALVVELKAELARVTAERDYARQALDQRNVTLGQTLGECSRLAADLAAARADRDSLQRQLDVADKFHRLEVAERDTACAESKQWNEAYLSLALQYAELNKQAEGNARLVEEALPLVESIFKNGHEMGAGWCVQVAGLARAALAAGKEWQIPIVEDPEMSKGRAEFRQNGKILGVIENLGDQTNEGSAE